MQQKHVEKEWGRLERAEGRFLERNLPERASGWQQSIGRFVPEKLEETLNTAFFKAFGLIFDKGVGVIERTYAKEKKEQDYKVNLYAADVRNTRRSLRAFGRAANASRGVNMAVSAVEGVGMGILGMGIPDIPLFLGVLLKSIYEIALSYGFSYDTEEEQIFILKLIETALSHGQALAEGDRELNLWIEGRRVDAVVSGDERKEEQMRRASNALAGELLYLKFVQGLPVVGVLGGLSDVVYQKKISDYAALKYKRRFLSQRRGRGQVDSE